MRNLQCKLIYLKKKICNARLQYECDTFAQDSVGSATMSSCLSSKWQLHSIPLLVQTKIQGWNRFAGNGGIKVKDIDILPEFTDEHNVNVAATIELENQTPLSAKLGFLPAHYPV